MTTTREVPESSESLWLLAASPAIWTAHFLLSYSTAAIWCGMIAGRDGSLWNVRLAIAGYTLVALIAIAITGWRGLRRYRLGGETEPHDADTPEDRHRFLGSATLLLSALSAIGTIYVALAAVFTRSCY